MDVASHFLWTNLAVRAVGQKQKIALWTAVFGVMPDFVSFGYNFANQAFLGRWNLAQVGNAFHLTKQGIPEITFSLFNLSHSLVFFGAVVLFIVAIRRHFWFPLWGWGFHILVDIPTHSINFFPPPYLYPFHTPLVDGYSWANPYFMLVNFLLLFYIYHELHLKKHTTRLMRAIFKSLGKPDKLGE